VAAADHDMHPDAVLAPAGILTSIETTWAWAKTMTWRGVVPIVQLLDRVYETGVRLSPRVFRPIVRRDSYQGLSHEHAFMGFPVQAGSRDHRLLPQSVARFPGIRV
jgi:hypothetical protein